MKGYNDSDQKQHSFVKVNSQTGSLYNGSPEYHDNREEFEKTYSLSGEKIKELNGGLFSIKSDFDDYYSSLSSKSINKIENYDSGFTFSKAEKYEFLKSLTDQEKRVFKKKETGMNELIRMQDELNEEVDNDLQSTQQLLEKMPETSPSFYGENSNRINPNNISNEINSFDCYTNSERISPNRLPNLLRETHLRFGRDSDYDYSKDNSGDFFKKHIHMLNLEEEKNDEEYDEDQNYRTPYSELEFRKLSSGAVTRFDSRFRTFERSQGYNSSTFCFDNILFSNENQNNLVEKNIEDFRKEVEIEPYSEKEEEIDDILLQLRNQKAKYLDMNSEKEELNFSETDENLAIRFRDLNLDQENNLFEDEMRDYIDDKDRSKLLNSQSNYSSQEAYEKAISSPSLKRERPRELQIDATSMDNTMFPNSILFEKQCMSITDLENSKYSDSEGGRDKVNSGISRTKKKKKKRTSGKKTSRRSKLRKKPPTPRSFNLNRVNNQRIEKIDARREKLDSEVIPIFNSKYIKMNKKEKEMIKDFNNTIDLNIEDIKEENQLIENLEELKIEDYSGVKDNENLIMMQQRVYLDYYKDNISEKDKVNFKSTLQRSIPSMGFKEDRLKRYFLETQSENEMKSEKDKEEEKTKRRNVHSKIKKNDTIGLVYVVKDNIDSDICKREIRMEISQIYVDEGRSKENESITSSGRSKTSDINQLSQRNYERVINSKFRNKTHLTEIETNNWAIKKADIKSESRDLSNYDLSLAKVDTPKMKKGSSNILKYSEEDYFVRSEKRIDPENIASAEDRFLSKVKEFEKTKKIEKRKSRRKEKSFNPMETQNHKEFLKKISDAVRLSKREIKYDIYLENL